MAEGNIPDWIDADFFKECLQSDKDNSDNISIISYKVKSAVPAGNNYSSNMLKAKVQYKKLNEEDNTHTISLIIKAPLTGGHIEEFKAFMAELSEKEPKFYNEFISETYKLCKHSVVPKHYTSPNPGCVVLEDLSTSGYSMVNRHDLLDFEQCRLYAKASGQLHALSFAVYKKKPEIIESVTKESPILADKLKQTYEGIVVGGFKCMAAYLEDKSEYHEYLDIIKEALKDNKISTIIKEMDEAKRDLRALTQPDPWCTNMLFKFSSSGKAVDVKLLDFQGQKFTTPVREFISFVWASAKPEVRETRLNELYHVYCDSLNTNLKELRCSERLSFEDLKEEIHFLSPLVLIVICMLVPICISDEVVDMVDLVSGNTSNVPTKERPIYKMYQGATFNKYYPKILEQAAEQGVFKYLKEKLSQM